MQRIYNKVKNFSGFKANTMDIPTDGLKKNGENQQQQQQMKKIYE